MPSDPESSTELSLPVDADLDALMAWEAWEDDDTEDAGQRHAERVARAASADARMRFAIGHRLLQVLRERDRLIDESEAMLAEYSRAIAPIQKRADDIENVLSAMALMHRAAGLGNTMVVPGVGEWTTRKKPARWDIANSAVVAALKDDPDGYQQFVDPGEPRPPEPKLRGDVFRAHLTQLLEDSLAGRDATPEERVEAARAVAEAWGAPVGYVPETIEATAHVEGVQS